MRAIADLPQVVELRGDARARALARGAAAVPAAACCASSSWCRWSVGPATRGRGRRGARPALGRTGDADRDQLRPLALPPYEAARAIDGQTVQAILDFRTDIDHEQACGATPVTGFLLAAKRRGLTAELLDLRNSGDTAGGRDRVVGYASFAFWDGRAPATTKRTGARCSASRAARVGEALGSGVGRDPGRAVAEGAAARPSSRSTRTAKLRGCIGSLQPHARARRGRRSRTPPRRARRPALLAA